MLLFKNVKYYFKNMQKKINDYSQENSFKIPPHSVEAEQAVLGGLMLDNQSWDRISELVREEDFYRSNHRRLFCVLAKMAAESQPMDVITVSELLKSYNWLDEAGGEGYLFQLAQNTPSAANIAAYASIVRQKSILRQLITSSNDIAELAYKSQFYDAKDLLDMAQSKIMSISNSDNTNNAAQHIRYAMTSAIEKIEKTEKNQTNITGIATGFTEFDNLTCGLQNGELIIVAGRPSMGKTAFAVNIATNIASEDRAVLIYSMEMPSVSLATRIIASDALIDTGANSNEKYNWKMINNTFLKFSEKEIYIDESSALTPLELRSRTRNFKKSHENLALVIIDYLQLMQLPEFSKNRVQEISKISRAIKSLAIELNIPIIAISQLNRSLELRSNKRPIMSDLRDSGAIEQDADVIVFIYRDEVYQQTAENKGKAEVIISKQRNGPIGDFKLLFESKYTKFKN